MQGGTASAKVAGAGLGLAVVGSGDVAGRVVSGAEEPFQGWVTERHARRRPAPVLSFEQRGEESWFVTAIAPSRAGEITIPGLVAHEEGGSLAVELGVADRQWSLRLGPGADLRLTRVP
jgi:hypothetical protein